MRTLASVTHGLSIAAHRKIVASKEEPRRTRLSSMDSHIDGRIAALEKDGPFALPIDDLGHSCPRRLQPIAPCARCPYDDLEHLWSTETNSLEILKHELREQHGTGRCPYCGLSEALTFDHYLPKVRFPEFSVAALNLIPSCGTCNAKKGDLVPDGSDRFLHPMSDPLDVRLLRCTISGPPGPPTITFGVDVQAATGFGVLGPAQFHFERLALGDRMFAVASPRVASFLSQLNEKNIPIASFDAANLAAQRVLFGLDGDGPNSWLELTFGALEQWILLLVQQAN